MKRFFCVNAGKYDSRYNFMVYRPASLDNPKTNAVMFMNKKNLDKVDVFKRLNHCIVFYPEELSIDTELKKNILFIPSKEPRTSYCLFFKENRITNYPPKEEYLNLDGALISKNARIGDNTTIMPFAFIGNCATIGSNCYIGSGVRIVGDAVIGDNVVIRENTVIGADGLSTDRDSDGKAATMPQFGAVTIEDNVQIGANCVIARGAIDDTIIKSGSKIDNSSFISHNVVIGEDTFIVGETIMFGGSSTGNRVFISGNSTIRNKTKIEDDSFVGMGSVVVKNVNAKATVMGNPAHER